MVLDLCSSSRLINLPKICTVIYWINTAVLYWGAEALSALPSVVVIKTFVAKMLATGQMIPARCVAIFSTPETRHRKLPSSNLIDQYLQGCKSVKTLFLLHATFQMHLQNKRGTSLSIQSSHTFCTSSPTGRLLPQCLWLFFYSRREFWEFH